MGMIGGILGGVGIFLIGMTLLTEGLKAAAGDALRRGLQRFAGGPGSALLSGVAFTALVQSSSATTVATIGFVSAGLLTFPQAVGVIFGANLGTTSTGWLVSLLGFKVSLTLIALPLVGVGALARVLLRGAAAQAGLALAGFGLIFVGIGTLQVGMADLADRVDPTRFPGGTLAGRAALLAVGFGMTVVMQSSSAAIATTLAAVHAGGIALDQAALLVIGQNLGTTVNAGLAAIGGSMATKRTAVAHVSFNVVTAVLAVLLLPLLLPLSTALSGGEDPAVAIAFFHSSFNVLGILVLFPMIARFSALIERLLPSPDDALTEHLDPSVTEIPAVAIEVARRSVGAIGSALFQHTRAALRLREGHDRPPKSERLPDRGIFPLALSEVRTFLGGVRTSAVGGDEHRRHLSILHAVDHLDRYVEAMEEFEEGRRPRDPMQRLSHARTLLDQGLIGALALPREVASVKGASAALADYRKAERLLVLEEAALGSLAPEVGWEVIDEIKCLDRMGYHAWRACHHLALADGWEAGKAGGAGGAGGGPGEGAGKATPEAFEDREADG